MYNSISYLTLGPQDSHMQSLYQHSFLNVKQAPKLRFLQKPPSTHPKSSNNNNKKPLLHSQYSQSCKVSGNNMHLPTQP